jgi:hypothetical protein
MSTPSQQVICTVVQVHVPGADKTAMNYFVMFFGVHPALFLGQTLLCAGAMLTLYIMRRRVRLGRRTPTF